MSIFLPVGTDAQAVLDAVVGELSLTIDVLPPGFPSDFSAQRCEEGLRTSYLLIDHKSDCRSYVEEVLTTWERPTTTFKELLATSTSLIAVTYRGRDWTIQCLRVIAVVLGDAAANVTVVHNGEGCLLRLSDMIERLRLDATWDWERQAFPELPGVAISEWA